MHTLRNKLIAIAAVGVLAVIGFLMNPRQAVAQNPDPGSAPVHIVSPLPLMWVAVPLSYDFCIHYTSPV
jgi:hypothetical protein